jgi:hypothetical protein
MIKKPGGKVEDFMKIKVFFLQITSIQAIRDQLNAKRDKVLEKVERCKEKIKSNLSEIQMLEFE